MIGIACGFPGALAAGLFSLTLVLGAPALAQPVLTLMADAAGETVELTSEDLEALPQQTVVTANEFAEGEVAYRGPLARDVLDRLELDELETVRFIAANDYYVDVPTSDLREYDVILAMEADGKRLSLRDKGPLWLMYPISDHPELNDPLYISRLIWQVVRIEAP